MLQILDSPIIAWISILLITSLYIPLNKRLAITYPMSRWDLKIPLIPEWTYVYIAYFPFVVLSCFLLPLHQTLGLSFTVSYCIGSFLAVCIWFFFPTGVKRPTPPTHTTLHHKILHHLYTHDGDTNAAPSGHVLHTLICAYYIALAFPHVAILAYATLTLIGISTVLIKQHYVFDIPAGLLVGILGIIAGRMIVA